MILLSTALPGVEGSIGTIFVRRGNEGMYAQSVLWSISSSSSMYFGYHLSLSLSTIGTLVLEGTETVGSSRMITSSRQVSGVIKCGVTDPKISRPMGEGARKADEDEMGAGSGVLAVRLTPLAPTGRMGPSPSLG